MAIEYGAACYVDLSKPWLIYKVRHILYFCSSASTIKHRSCDFNSKPGTALLPNKARHQIFCLDLSIEMGLIKTALVLGGGYAAAYALFPSFKS